MNVAEGRLPDFLVIGATKAGTTSLDFYLSLHPEIHMARPKEPRYFVDAAEPLGRWGRGEDWYCSLFNSTKQLVGETSPAYTHAPAFPGVAARAAAVVPNAKLIYVVREPLARLRSHFLMNQRNGNAKGTLVANLNGHPEPSLLLASLYATQLAEWMKFYPPRQILVVATHDLETNRAETLRRVFAFLGADPDFASPLFRHRRNVTRQQVLPNDTGRKLLASAPLQLAARHLPSPVFYHVRNLLLLPFAARPPDMTLPPEIEEPLRARLRDEVNRLRLMTGQALPGLD